MVMMVAVPGARRLDEGVWKARLSPAEARILGAGISTYGPVSIALLKEAPRFNETDKSLSFNPSAVHLLNLSTSDQVIIIHSSGLSSAATSAKAKRDNLSSGDARFLSELPTELREFGTSLLREARKYFPGELKFYPRSGKDVETPDNFWTVRIQTRDRTFRITVRGKPDTFSKSKSINLKPDMTGYSSFKISSTSQIPELLEVLHQAGKR